MKKFGMGREEGGKRGGRGIDILHVMLISYLVK